MGVAPGLTAMIRVRAATLILVATSALFVQQGGAQVIDGVVVDSSSRVPVAGALVSLVDNDGRDLQRFMVDADGSFRFFVAGPPGTYSLRAERLGMATTTVGGLDLGPADTVTVRIALRQRPIALTGIEVSGARRCELRAAVGEATQRVWEGARMALLAIDASGSGRYVYDLERHVRELEPGSLTIRSETRTRTRSMDDRPIRSRPVELLVSDGWVVGDEGGYRYSHRTRTRCFPTRSLPPTACGCAPATSRASAWSVWSFGPFVPNRSAPTSRASFGCRARPANSNGSTSSTAACPGLRQNIEAIRSVAAWSFSACPTADGSSRSGTSGCR